MPRNVKVLVLPPWTAWKCLDTEEIFKLKGLSMSDKCRRMRIFSALTVQPTYCTLHALHGNIGGIYIIHKPNNKMTQHTGGRKAAVV